MNAGDWGPAGLLVSGFSILCTALAVYIRGENARSRLLVREDIARSLEPITMVVRQNELDIATLTERHKGVSERLQRHDERIRDVETREKRRGAGS